VFVDGSSVVLSGVASVGPSTKEAEMTGVFGKMESCSSSCASTPSSSMSGSTTFGCTPVSASSARPRRAKTRKFGSAPVTVPPPVWHEPPILSCSSPACPAPVHKPVTVLPPILSDLATTVSPPCSTHPVSTGHIEHSENDDRDVIEEAFDCIPDDTVDTEIVELHGLWIPVECRGYSFKVGDAIRVESPFVSDDSSASVKVTLPRGFIGTVNKVHGDGGIRVNFPALQGICYKRDRWVSPFDFLKLSITGTVDGDT